MLPNPKHCELVSVIFFPLKTTTTTTKTISEDGVLGTPTSQSEASLGYLCISAGTVFIKTPHFAENVSAWLPEAGKATDIKFYYFNAPVAARGLNEITKIYNLK